MSKKTQLSKLIGIAICGSSIELTTTDLQLIPAGKFDAPLGSMLGVKGPWFIDEDIAAAAIARIQQLENDIVIDFEHQTMLAAENGKPAPAAGWIKRKDIKWVAGKGLVAETVNWTDEAKAFIDSGQYKYLSPVFAFSKSTGNVLDIRQVALTNNPAIDGMDEVVAAATAKFLPHHQEETPMDPELLKLLGLDDAATKEEVLAACTALKADKDTLTKQLADKDEAIAAATAATPDSAMQAIAGLQQQVAALTANQTTAEMDTLIAAAKTAGKLIPAQEDWARGLGVDKLKGYLETAPQIAALTQQQTDGKEDQFDKDGKAVLSDEQIAMCSSMGISQEDYAKTLEAEKN